MMPGMRSLIFVVLVQLCVTKSAISDDLCSEAGVRAAVSVFGRAFELADVAALEASLAAGYIHINGRSGGVINRVDWLGWVSSRRGELEKGTLLIGAYEVQDIDVVMYGKTAVVTGLVYSSGHRNGDPFESGVRFSNVWVCKDGTWLRAAFHDSQLPDSAIQYPISTSETD
jgi:hypothetical protein